MKRSNWFRRFVAVLMASMLVLSAGSALAAEEMDVSGDKTAAPTELTGDERETTVTLELPSGEYKNQYDIVFVMDSSSSTRNSNIDFSVYADELFSELAQKDADLRVGVIKCRGLAFDTIHLANEQYSGLVTYSDETSDAIKAGMNFSEADLKALSSGTNMHGALDMANDWLVGDKDVADDHKFVIMLTDGKTYIWNNDSDVPTTYYGQYAGQRHAITSVPSIGQQTTAYSKSAYRMVDGVNYFKETEEMKALPLDEYFAATGNFYTADFAKLYASTNADLTGASEYEYRCAYAYKEGAAAAGTVTTHPLTNGTYTYALHNSWFEFVPDASFADLKWLQANPYTVQDNGDGTYSYTTTVNPDFYQRHPDSLQKGLYMLAHLWTDMVARYNAAAVVYNGWGSGSGLEIAKSFNDWIKLAGNSDYAADIMNVDAVKAVFDTIKEEILYMVARGTVTDVIGADWNLKEQEENTFRMTLGGEAVACTYDAAAEFPWSFGEPDENGVYPYTVKVDGSTITWVLNVPVENLKQVTLSYDLILKDEKATEGTHDTNQSAVLDYTSTDGKKDGTFTFPVPTVTYHELTDITVIKVWEDEDDKDGLRPDSVIVNLLADGEATDYECELSEEGKWTYTFEELRKYNDNGEEIKYTVEEEPVEGYEDPEIAVEEGVFTITNTHVPETEPVTEPEEIPDETVPLAPPTEEETETEEDTTAAPTTTAEEIEENDVPLTPPTITPVTPTQPTRVPMDHGYEEIIDDEVPQALPVTGQVNWPILVLTIAGVVMLGAATIIRRRQKTEG